MPLATGQSMRIPNFANIGLGIRLQCRVKTEPCCENAVLSGFLGVVSAILANAASYVCVSHGRRHRRKMDRPEWGGLVPACERAVGDCDQYVDKAEGDFRYLTPFARASPSGPVCLSRGTPFASGGLANPQ